MSYMFANCSSLTSLNLSYFNTNNVNNMSYICSINVINFNTNNVTIMRYMLSVWIKLEI